MRMIFAVAPRAIEPNHPIIAPTVDSSRRTWRQAATPARSTALTMAASQTSTPSAASPASAEACMAAEEALGMVAAEAACVVEEAVVGMVGEAEATGNRCGGNQFLKKKT